MIKQNTFNEMLKTGEFAGMVRETTRGQQINNSAELYNILYPLTQQAPIPGTVQGCLSGCQKQNNHHRNGFNWNAECRLGLSQKNHKAALRHNAAAVIAAHNHPSGGPEPSKEDAMPRM